MPQNPQPIEDKFPIYYLDTDPYTPNRTVERLVHLTQTQRVAIDSLLACGIRAKVEKDMRLPSGQLDEWLSNHSDPHKYYLALVNQRARATMLTKDYVDAKLVEALNTPDVQMKEKVALLKTAHDRIVRVSAANQIRPAIGLQLEVVESGAPPPIEAEAEPAKPPQEENP